MEGIRSLIDTYIKKNGNQDITGDVLNNVMQSLVDDFETYVLDGLEELRQEIPNISGGGGGGSITLDSSMSDTSTNGVQNKVIKGYVDSSNKSILDGLASMWHLDENGNLVTDKQVIIKNNLLVEGDAASGGEGGDNPGGGGGGDLDIDTLEAYLSDNRYINANNLDTYGVATKSWVSGNYLALSGGTLYNTSTDTPLYLMGNSAGAYIGFKDTNNNFLGYYGFSQYTPMVYVGTSASYSLIHSGNIGSQSVASAQKVITADGINALEGDTATLRVGYGYRNLTTNIYGNEIYFAKNGAINMAINSSGNVLIGTTTDLGSRLTISNPSSRDVLCINSNASNGPIVYLAASNQLTAGFGYDGVAKVMWFENFSASSGLYLNNVGNVGIGTTSPQYKLDVNGTISVVDGIRIGGTNNAVAGLYRNGYITSDNKPNRLWLYNQAEIAISATTLQILTSTTISGNLIVSGDVASGSDIRFKDIIEDKTIKIEHIAKAPLFTFKWNNRDDDAIHLGSSAQYWENITPWLVKGEDFKTLDYSTLGVAMGISLAKKAVNHEERIKVLEKEIKRLKEEMRYGG